ncbi:hypothetical protein Gohar_002495, partial [Gossypium harknessii]|nr:hypothetical protein [Gossypium harknessii]
HGVKDCTEIPSGDRVKAEDDLPYSLALKAESSIIGKESLLFGSLMKRTMKQYYYRGMEATSRDKGFSPDSMKQIHRTAKESYSEKNFTFLETESDDIEPYSFVDDIAKRVKSDSGYSEVLTIIEHSWPISKDDLDSSQIISTTAKWQADRKQ